jgi:type I restriction enzyme S subunit
MIEGLKPYAEYKESGLPWLGRCPRHWNVRRTKILFHERVQKGFPHEPLLAATQTKGVVKKEDYETRTVTAQKDLHLLKLVEVGDYVISLRSFQGGIEVAHCRGIISPAYTVLKPQKQAVSRYYSHFFKAKPFIDSLSLFVTGIREGQNINYERLSRAEMPMPPEEEQAAIVRFLDHANRKIEGFIRARRKLIGLLNEQKQAIIHRAVTRGLHPDVPLKPSGIPWLGDIPAHWEVRRLKSVLRSRLTNGLFKRGDDFGSGVLLVNVSDVYDPEGVIRPEKLDRVRCSKEELATFRVAAGDMFFVRSSLKVEGTGRCALIQTLPEDAVFECHLVRCRPDGRIVDSNFLSMFLRSWAGTNNVVAHANTVTISTVGQSEISSLPVVVPPLAEQKELLQRVAVESDPITTAIARTEREIALMQEYRTRLTADIVTGKLDVREAAAKLPDLPVVDTDTVPEESLEEPESEDED